MVNKTIRDNNVLLFYFSKVLQLLFPIITTAFLARRLEISDFGYIIICQSIALVGSSIIEYGFNYMGARKVALNRENKLLAPGILAEFNSAKITLLPICLAFIFSALYLTKVPQLYWPAVFLISLSQGFNLLWYFQGIDRVYPAIAIDIIAKAIVVVAVIVLPINGVIYLFILGVTLCASLILLYAYFVGTFPLSSIQLIRESPALLKEGRDLFFSRAGSILYSSAVNPILALNIPPSILSIYGGADRLYRAASSLTAPVGDAYYANIAANVIEDPLKSRQLMRKASRLLMIVSLCILIIGEIFADLIVRIILGDKFVESAEILRILLISVPFIASGTVIFVLYLLPRGKDRTFALATLISGIWVCGFSVFFAPRLGLQAMAWAIVFAEILVNIIGLYFVFLIRRENV